MYRVIMILRNLLRFLFVITLLASCSNSKGLLEEPIDRSNICGKLPAIIGNAYVADGDTITVDGQKIRLIAIDAPEVKQSCEKKNTHEAYECGLEAKQALQLLLKDNRVICCTHGIDLYRRVLAECFIENLNINRHMVITGQAILYNRAKAYKSEEEFAKEASVGIWSSLFEKPIDWRKAHKRKSN